MREIKFRGMLRNGEWVYGGYVKIEDGANCILSGECDHYDIGGKIKNVLGFNAVKYKTVGQYTGLKDKNGKEIYEGDIVTGYTSYENDNDAREWTINKPATVYYDEEYCAFYPFYLNARWRCDVVNIEVIGNIYENKEVD